MTETSILILSIAFGFVNYGLLAKWYLMPALNSVTRTQALKPLLFLHSFRYIGLVFIIPGVVSPELSSSFATPAAYGDLLAAVFALLALGSLHRGWSFSLPLVWIFNITGTLDLLFAVNQGLRHTLAHQLGAAYFIPVVIVPALLITHFIIFILLLRTSKEST